MSPADRTLQLANLWLASSAAIDVAFGRDLLERHRLASGDTLAMLRSLVAEIGTAPVTDATERAYFLLCALLRGPLMDDDHADVEGLLDTFLRALSHDDVTIRVESIDALLWYAVWRRSLVRAKGLLPSLVRLADSQDERECAAAITTLHLLLLADPRDDAALLDDGVFELFLRLAVNAPEHAQEQAFHALALLAADEPFRSRIRAAGVLDVALAVAIKPALDRFDVAHARGLLRAMGVRDRSNPSDSLGKRAPPS